MLRWRRCWCWIGVKAREELIIRDLGIETTERFNTRWRQVHCHLSRSSHHEIICGEALLSHLAWENDQGKD